MGFLDKLRGKAKEVEGKATGARFTLEASMAKLFSKNLILVTTL